MAHPNLTDILAAPEAPSLADCPSGSISKTSRHTFPIRQDLANETILLSEDESHRGLRTLILKDRLITEGGAAVSHAAILAGKARLTGPFAAILSGRNIALARLRPQASKFFPQRLTAQPANAIAEPSQI